MRAPLSEKAMLLTKEDVAELARLAPRSVDRLVSRGVLRRIKPAGMSCVRFVRAEVEEWISRGCPER